MREYSTVDKNYRETAVGSMESDRFLESNLSSTYVALGKLLTQHSLWASSLPNIHFGQVSYPTCSSNSTILGCCHSKEVRYVKWLESYLIQGQCLLSGAFYSYRWDPSDALETQMLMKTDMYLRPTEKLISSS